MTNGILPPPGAPPATAGDLLAEGFRAEARTWDRFGDWLVARGPALALRALLAGTILLVGWGAIRLATSSLSRVLKRTPLAGLMADFLVNVCHKALWALLIVAALSLLGVDVTALLAGLGLAGFILGFAFKDALGNLASGMMIALNQPFSAGDYVILGGAASGIQGTVKRLTMTMTELETPDGKKVVVPNSVVWGSAITNFTAPGRRRVDLAMSIAYASDIDRAKAALKEALLSVPEVLKDPEPVVELLSFADSAIVIACRPYCKAADYWKVAFGANRRMLEALRAAGIEIPFPQVDVRTRT
ncbi:MAG: mechanosensitive ion channel family protein [Kiritimatiellae bacterium]|nr:mechanosensitive ion channel family protein [Kiritimatiellia bacterium]